MKGNFLGMSWNSVRLKILIGILVITLFLTVLLVINNLYAINVVRKQVAISNQNMMSLYMGQIDKGLEDADQYLISLRVTDDNFRLIESSDSLDEILLAKVRLQETLSSTLLINKTIESFFVYSSNLDNMTDVFKNESDYTERERIRTFIRSRLGSSSDFYQNHAASWFVQKLGDEYYLFRIVQSGSTYIGAWVNVKTLQKPLTLINIGENGDAFLTTDSGVPMKEAPLIHEEGIELSRNLNHYYMTGRDNNYLVVGNHSSISDFSLVAIIPDDQILENLPIWIRFALLILAGFILLLPGFFLFLRKTVMLPLYRIITVMRKFGDGDVNIRMNERKVSDEFIVLNEAFNRMASQIEQLKIHVYEEQLSKQKAELQHLQLQMNPHFFMNALNIVYAFARAQKYELIQEMTLCLVRYFRYMFKSNLTYISLKDELEHVKNYLRIQEIRYPDTLHCEITAPETLLDIKIPQLVIHTFVENTIKHEVSLNDPVDIFITVDLDESRSDPYLTLIIRDTGKGFKEDVLTELRQGNRIIDEQGEHIGIWNVMHRLRLLYGGKAMISFSNSKDSGAFIEMRLPIMLSEEGQADEYFDR